jgi:hypothetical protein
LLVRYGHEAPGRALKVRAEDARLEPLAFTAVADSLRIFPDVRPVNEHEPLTPLIVHVAGAPSLITILVTAGAMCALACALTLTSTSVFALAV